MDTNSIPALTETVYYILLTLQKPMHGYGIMQNIKSITQSRINMGAGTLYGALSTLQAKGYIEEHENSEPGKKEYIITHQGLEVLKDEMKRLQELLENGKIYFKGDKCEEAN